MTQVDFYVLPEGARRDDFACRLIEKVYRTGCRVYVHTASAQRAQAIDDFLWSFRGGSFVPHEVLDTARQPDSPVLIGYQNPPEAGHEVLVNLSDTLPEFFGQFARIAELVDADPDVKLKARERYRYYREHGCPLESHTIDAAQLSSNHERE